VRTHPVDKLLEQHCYKSAAGLLQLVRFYVCNSIDSLYIWTEVYFEQIIFGVAFIEYIFKYKTKMLLCQRKNISRI
jgi:hypothetical protein